ncbi:uncharacterized protein ACRADG_009743 isoform 1-T2 [Cochliomyia hominivorax]
MCLYMSVPKWLSFQNFLKAINESINHTIDVTLMFIYFKCLNNNNNNKNNNNVHIITINEHKNCDNNNNNSKQQQNKYLKIKSPTTTTIKSNMNKNHKIDFNVKFHQKINQIEKFSLHKTCSEFPQAESILTIQQQLQQQQYQSHLQQNQHLHEQHLQQHYHQHHLHLQQHLYQQYLCHNEQTLLMEKFKTFPLHI